MIVMLVPSLISLAIAIVALYISFKVTDEIAQLIVTLTALLCLFLSLVFTPWPAALLMMMAILVINKHIKPLIQADLEAGEGREIACPFSLAFAVTHRCAAYPTTSPLWRLGEKKMQRACMQHGCYAPRKNR